MNKRTVSLRYSKALFDLDVANGNLEKRLVDFEWVLGLFRDYPKLMKLLQAPQIDLEEKKRVMQSCIQDRLDPVFKHFLFYLIEKKRLGYLPQIGQEFRLMFDDYLRIWEANIITASPLEKDSKEKLKEKLERLYRKKIKIKEQVDSKIIGGAILLVANEMIDWSVKGRLKKMKASLLDT